ncbi:MAG: nuclear transport factor 2 family protein [Acidimicrobiales bacterium]
MTEANDRTGRGAAMDIGYVIDCQAIRDLQVAYSMAIDDGRYDELDRIFTADVVADYGHAGQHRGVETIKAACRTALEPLTSSQHQNGNHWAEIDGDRATAGCYFTVTQHKQGTPGGDLFRMGGRYDDELVRNETGTAADRQAGWRIAKRTLTVLWSDGNPDVRFVR